MVMRTTLQNMPEFFWPIAFVAVGTKRLPFDPTDSPADDLRMMKLKLKHYFAISQRLSRSAPQRKPLQNDAFSLKRDDKIQNVGIALDPLGNASQCLLHRYQRRIENRNSH